MRFRNAVSGDIDNLLSAYHLSFDKLYPPFRYPDFLSLFASKTGKSFICFDDDNNQTIGFASADIHPEDRTTVVIRTLFTIPHYRQKGVGSKLLTLIEQFAKQNEAKKIILGPLLDNYFSLGLPINSQEYDFFIHREFSEDNEFGYHPVWMTVDLTKWSPPERFESIHKKLKAENIEIRITTKEDQSKLLELTAKHFPGWHRRFFKLNAESQNPAPSAIAIKGNQSAGFVGPLWVKENRFGMLGAVGVSPDFRRKGIALAALTYACYWWKENGAKQADLWTGTNNPALKLYEELGFYIKETYAVVSKFL